MSRYKQILHKLVELYVHTCITTRQLPIQVVIFDNEYFF